MISTKSQKNWNLEKVNRKEMKKMKYRKMKNRKMNKSIKNKKGPEMMVSNEMISLNKLSVLQVLNQITNKKINLFPKQALMPRKKRKKKTTKTWKCLICSAMAWKLMKLESDTSN